MLFWTAAGVVIAFAALIGSLSSTATAAWLRKRHRPEADWVVELNANVSDPPNPVVQILGTISNAGDAPGYRVRLEVSYGIPDLTNGTTFKPIVKPGEEFQVDFTFPHPGDWNRVSFRLFWVSPPTRLKKEQELEFYAVDHVPDPLEFNYP